jgi:hypothetical protein
MSDIDKLWCKYCNFAFKLYHSNELAEFQNELHMSLLPRIKEPQLMAAAIHLVGGMPDAGVRRWNWLPPPAPMSSQTRRPGPRNDSLRSARRRRVPNARVGGTRGLRERSGSRRQPAAGPASPHTCRNRSKASRS